MLFGFKPFRSFQSSADDFIFQTKSILV